MDEVNAGKLDRPRCARGSRLLIGAPPSAGSRRVPASGALTPRWGTYHGVCGNAVDDDIRRVRNDQLASAFNGARSTGVGKVAELISAALDRKKDPLSGR